MKHENSASQSPFSSKKGLISVQTSAVFLRVILIALALVIPPALVSIFLADNINTIEIQSDLLVTKALFSPEGMGYFDTAAQAAPVGVIDSQKLALAAKDPKYLDRSMIYTDSPMGAKITIGESAVYYNKALYDDYSAAAKTHLKGKGGADLVERTLAVIVRDSNRDRAATAKAEVVTPR